MTSEPRLAYTFVADDGKLYELEIRHLGTAVLFGLQHGRRDDVWVGDIWTDDQEDVWLLELCGWLEDPRFAGLGSRLGRGMRVAMLRLYTEPERELEICAALIGAPPLAVQICERLELIARMAHERRFTQRRVNPIRASRSGEIG